MEDLVDSLTRGNVSQVKTVLASVVAVLSAIHVVAGSVLVAAIVLKVIVVRWWHRMNRYLPALGLTVFALFLVTWFTSAGNYLIGD